MVITVINVVIIKDMYELNTKINFPKMFTTDLLTLVFKSSGL